LAAICEVIHAHVAPIRAALICDYMVFAKLLASEDKRRDLIMAMTDGSASSFGITD
jgi:Mg-chelatase subunit ChlD